MFTNQLTYKGLPLLEGPRNYFELQPGVYPSFGYFTCSQAVYSQLDTTKAEPGTLILGQGKSLAFTAPVDAEVKLHRLYLVDARQREVYNTSTTPGTTIKSTVYDITLADPRILWLQKYADRNFNMLTPTGVVQELEYGHHPSGSRPYTPSTYSTGEFPGIVPQSMFGKQAGTNLPNGVRTPTRRLEPFTHLDILQWAFSKLGLPTQLTWPNSSTPYGSLRTNTRFPMNVIGSGKLWRDVIRQVLDDAKYNIYPDLRSSALDVQYILEPIHGRSTWLPLQMDPMTNESSYRDYFEAFSLFDTAVVEDKSAITQSPTHFKLTAPQSWSTQEPTANTKSWVTIATLANPYRPNGAADDVLEVPMHWPLVGIQQTGLSFASEYLADFAEAFYSRSLSGSMFRLPVLFSVPMLGAARIRWTNNAQGVETLVDLSPVVPEVREPVIHPDFKGRILETTEIWAIITGPHPRSELAAQGYYTWRQANLVQSGSNVSPGGGFNFETNWEAGAIDYGKYALSASGSTTVVKDSVVLLRRVGYSRFDFLDGNAPQNDPIQAVYVFTDTATDFNIILKDALVHSPNRWKYTWESFIDTDDGGISINHSGTDWTDLGYCWNDYEASNTATLAGTGDHVGEFPPGVTLEPLVVGYVPMRARIIARTNPDENGKLTELRVCEPNPMRIVCTS